MEQWVEMVRFKTERFRYYVSNQGNFKRLTIASNKTKEIAKVKASLGYIKVSIGDKYHFAHRLVAEHFISNPNNLSDVNHIDEDKTNNCVDNLQWLSHKDNVNYGTRNERAKQTKLNNKQAQKERDLMEKYSYLLLGMIIGTINDEIDDDIKA